MTKRLQVNILEYNERGNVVYSDSVGVTEYQFPFLKALLKTKLFFSVKELEDVIGVLEFVDIKGYCESEDTNPIMEKLKLLGKIMSNYPTEQQNPNEVGKT